MLVPPRDGRLQLRDLLIARVDPVPPVRELFACDLLYSVTAADRDNPILLHWYEADGLHVAALHVEPSWSRSYLRARLRT